MSWRRASSVLLRAALGWTIVLACTAARAFPSAGYLPLVDGYSWTYRVDGVDGATRSVLPGTFDVNGIPTRGVRELPEDAVVFRTNDANGIRDHGYRQSTYIPGLGLTQVRITVSPALVHLGADASIGVAVPSAGSALVEIAGLGTFSGSYSATATPVAYETVTVPAGTFVDALKIQSSAVTQVDVFGETITITTTAETWMVENVGVVKEAATTDGIASTLVLTGLNYAPALTFSSLSAIWGSQPATGAPGFLLFGPQVTNNSPFTVHLTSIAVTGEFGLAAGGSCTELLPGQSCFIEVDFRPASVGLKTGALTITSDAIGSPFVYPLTGTGSGVGVATLTPNSLDFGNQDRGVTSTPRTVTMTNSGSASLDITSIATTGQYGLASNCGASLAIGASCDLQVTFTPFAAQVVSGDLIIDTPSDRLFVRLTGTGIGAAPPASVSPGDLTFGAVQVGTTSPMQTFMLNNDGGSHLNVFGIGPMPGSTLGDFSFATSCPAVLPAGASCPIHVTFTPTTTGERYGYLAIETDGALSAGSFLKPLVGIGASGAVDTLPNALAIAPVRGAPFNTRMASAPIVVTGIDAAAPIGITGGSYRINGGFYMQTPGIVLPGDSVVVYAYSASLPATTRQAVLTIGGAQGVFAVTTAGTAGRDIDGDGRTDIVWRHGDGTNYVWQMNGTQIAGQGLLPGAGAGWAITGLGDFNGDGKGDILWRHTDGTNFIWLLDGDQLPVGGVYPLAGGAVLPAVTDANWSVAGVGDFNGDGKADILWRRTDGTNYVWHVDASVIVGGIASIPSQGLLPGVPASWTVAGIGDFNGDGRSDILWRHGDGINYVWHIDGTQIAGGVLSIASQGLLPGVAAPWAVAGIGDFDADGKSDILWRHADGTNYVWQVDGATIAGGLISIASQGLLPGVPDIGWSVVGTGDYNGDGRSDIFWRHTDGTNYLWHIDGSVISGGVLSIPSQGMLPGVPDPAWQVQNPK